MKIVLETSRLLMRQFTLDDASLIMELNSDPEVLAYLHEPMITDEDFARKILNDIILPQYTQKRGRWALITKTRHEFIGWCGLKTIGNPATTDLGYRLKKTAWGNGYATEAAKACLDYGFTELELPEIIGRAHIQNSNSQKILEKIGMQFQAVEIEDDVPVKTYKAFRSPAF